MHQLLVKENDKIEEILATRVGKKTHQKEYLEYLVKWKNSPLSESTWISANEFLGINGDLYECFHSLFFLASVKDFTSWGEMMGNQIG